MVNIIGIAVQSAPATTNDQWTELIVVSGSVSCCHQFRIEWLDIWWGFHVGLALVNGLSKELDEELQQLTRRQWSREQRHILLTTTNGCRRRRKEISVTISGGGNCNPGEASSDTFLIFTIKNYTKWFLYVSCVQCTRLVFIFLSLSFDFTGFATPDLILD